MPEFVTAPDGVALAYERHGAGPAIMLVHGFGSSRLQNWKSTGWFGGLAEAGFSLVAMDSRGHGDSGKPHDPAAYSHDRMADDVTLVMDACGLDRALVLGYSMGGFIGLRLLAAHPDRVIKLAVAGVGANYLDGGITAPPARSVLADALLRRTRTVSPIRAPGCSVLLRISRARIASRSPPACARCRRISRSKPCRGCNGRFWLSTAAKMKPQVPPHLWRKHFANGRAVTIDGRDHMSAVGDRRTRQAVIDFFR